MSFSNILHKSSHCAQVVIVDKGQGRLVKLAIESYYIDFLKNRALPGEKVNVVGFSSFFCISL